MNANQDHRSLCLRSILMVLSQMSNLAHKNTTGPQEREDVTPTQYSLHVSVSWELVYYYSWSYVIESRKEKVPNLR